MSETTPASTPQPAPPATPAQPTAPTSPPAPIPPATPAPTPGEADRGFPANTSLAEMTTEQQLAYWKFQARKHEDTAKARGDYDEVKAAADARAQELEQLRAAAMTESEKALDQARKDGEQAGRAAVAAEAAAREAARGAKFVDAMLEVAMAPGGRLDRDRVAPILEALDKSRYVNADGEVDTEAIGKLIDSLAGASPAPAAPAARPGWPSLGQGRQEATPAARGVAAGAAAFAARRGGAAGGAAGSPQGTSAR